MTCRDKRVYSLRQVESTVSFRGRVAVSVTTSPRWPLHVPTVTVPTGFTGELGYFIPVVSNKGRNVCFRIGLSALGGFETVNWGTSLLPDGASVTNGDSFIYGGGLTAAFDVWLTDQIILLMQVKERALFGTDAGNFHTQIGLGVRLIIN